MRVFLALLVGLLTQFGVNAQTPATLTVQAKGTVEALPDLLQLKLTLRQKSPEVQASIAALNSLTEKFKSLVLKTKLLQQNDLKTQAYSIRKDTYYNPKTGKSEFAGFVAQHNLLFTVKNSPENVNKVLQSLSNDLKDIDFSITPTCSQAALYKNHALRKAVKQAKEKMKILTQAASTKVVKLLDIQYADGKQSLPSPTNFRGKMMADAVGNYAELSSFNPDVQKFTEYVTLTWLLE